MLVVGFVDGGECSGAEGFVEMDDVIVYFFAGLGFAHSDNRL